MRSDHPLSKLRVALKTAMSDVKKIPFGPTGTTGPVLSGEGHRTNEEDLAKFAEIVSWLAQTTFGQSDCDMPWVQVVVVDRTRMEAIHFEPVPYSHKAKTEDDRWAIVRTAQMNLSIAASRLETALRIYESEKVRAKAAKP